jgi:PAS domain S-box-containing protein
MHPFLPQQPTSKARVNKIETADLTAVDIDNLNRGERQINEMWNRAHAMLETIRQPLLTLDSGLRVLWANAAYYATFQASPAGTERQRLCDLEDGLWNIPGLRPQLEDILAGNGRLENLEVKKNFPRIGCRTMLLSARQVVHEPGESNKRLLLAFEDVTDLRLAEESIRRMVAKEQSILDTAVDGIVTIDEQGLIETFNSAAERMFGYSAAEVIGRNVKVLMPPPYREEHDSYLARYLDTGDKRVIGKGRELIGRRKDGADFHLDLAVAEHWLGDQRKFTASLRDITERKESERHLREQAALLNQVHDAIMLRDLDDRIRFWSKGAERLYGWKAEEVLGQNASELLMPEDVGEAEAGQRELLEQGEWTGELLQQTRDGRKIIVEVRWTLTTNDQGRPIGKLVINSDVTEKKQRAAQTLRAQRLESIGILAGGIAHDFNNILTPMMMGVRLLRKKDRSEEDRRGLLVTLEASLERASELVRQILAFAGGIEGDRGPIRVLPVIQEVQALLQHTLMPSVRLRVNLGADLWPIAVDATLLSQVVMNLCVNARDAMRNGGDLVIEAENVSLDDTLALTHPEAKAGPYVLIAVADSGTGIPPHVLDKIFDPFFTTKESGKGTGLGLATVLGIVKRHGGFITVDSEVGKGTRFTIYLPALSPAEIRQIQRNNVAPADGAGEMILVVDDEASILLTVETTLEDHGYRVLTAQDGATALAMYRRHRSEVRAVLLDMMMPDMDGPAVTRALREFDPDVRILASSGLQVAARSADAMAAGALAFLQKPYSDEQLLAALKEICQSA